MAVITLPDGTKQRVGSIYCIGRNYADHAKELNNPIPKEPMVFLKPGGSLIGDGDTIVLPEQSRDVHHEVEVVILLNRDARLVPREEALNYVGGYAVGLDITARDIQEKAREKGHPWSVAKGFATFAVCSNFVEPGAIADPQNILLSLRINDHIRQQGNTRDMLFPISEIIHRLSGIFRLEAGDIIFTGTPAGVGPLQAGDQLYAEVNGGLANLQVSVAAAQGKRH